MTDTRHITIGSLVPAAARTALPAAVPIALHPAVLLALLAALLTAQLVLLGCATGVPDSEVAELYYNLGNAYTELGRTEEATNAYLQARELDEEFTAAGYNLARLYIDIGRLEQGKTILEKLLSDDPENNVLHSTLAWVAYLEGDKDGALAAYEAILERLPEDENALFNSAVIAWETDKHELALDRFLTLNRMKPASPYAYEIGRLYAETENFEQSIRYLEAYAEEHPDMYEVHMQRAIVYRRLEEYTRALEAYERALELKENDAEALFGRAVVFLDAIQDAERGIAALEQAVANGFSDAARATELADALGGEMKADAIAVLEAKNLYKKEDGGDDGANADEVRPQVSPPDGDA